jgi:hypothetical protein
VSRKATPYLRILIISPFFAVHTLRRTPTIDRQAILDLLAARDSALALPSLKDAYLSSAELANAKLVLYRVKPTQAFNLPCALGIYLIIILGRTSVPTTLCN